MTKSFAIRGLPGNWAARLGAGATTLVLLCSLSSAGTVVAAQALSEPASAVGGAPVMRRLTEGQYRATVADIFGADIPIVGRFERELRAEGLVAIGASRAGLSPFAVEQYDISARGIAGAVVSEEKRAELVPCTPRSEEHFSESCATTFVEHYGPLLFRRPLTNEERDLFVSAARGAHAELGNFYSGLEFALTGMLVSPDFLLRVERTEADPNRSGHYRLDAYSRASRLSFFLTGAGPDAELLTVAGSGELDTEEGLQRQIDRLMASPNYERGLRMFFEDMLEFDRFEDLAKDPIIYPAFNSALAEDAREQTLRTIIHHLLEKEGDYRDLFVTRDAHLTRALGSVYRMPVASRYGWVVSEFSESSGRAGIQSQLAFLSLHSHPGRSSPTLRGYAIRKVFMCQEVPDPPADVDFAGFSDDDTFEAATARDRLVMHATEPACKGCHVLMDPLGLTLESFDGLGAFRTHENGIEIDLSGSLDGREYTTPAGMGAALREHPQVTSCIVDKLYGAAVGRDTVPRERAYLQYLNRHFAENGYRIPDLMRTIAQSNTFYSVAPAEPSGSAASTTDPSSVNQGDQS